jgi:hypothetical protein
MTVLYDGATWHGSELVTPKGSEADDQRATRWW